MKVTLIGISAPEIFYNDAEIDDIVVTALSQCYNEKFDKSDLKKMTPEQKKRLELAVVKSGHESVTEHVSFTFLIEGVSRALTHQLVRHRIASFSQKSGRYTKVDDSTEWYVVPKSISKNPKALEIYMQEMKNISTAYEKLMTECDIPAEDARFLMPNGQTTNIVVTMNCRTLKNFFAHRLCTRAQWEIRGLANTMANICKSMMPILFEDAKFGYAKCDQLGYCPESKKHTCGRKKRLEDLIGDNK